MEDIIHRGGGNMIIELYNRTADEQCDTTDIEVVLDGERQRHKAGSRLRLTAGQSITLTQGLYHSFWAEPGFGPVILGEVSMVNDDRCDNRFLQRGAKLLAEFVFSCCPVCAVSFRRVIKSNVRVNDIFNIVESGKFALSVAAAAYAVRAYPAHIPPLITIYRKLKEFCTPLFLVWAGF
jgi:hypothetical protein